MNKVWGGRVQKRQHDKTVASTSIRNFPARFEDQRQLQDMMTSYTTMPFGKTCPAAGRTVLLLVVAFTLACVILRAADVNDVVADGGATNMALECETLRRKVNAERNSMLDEQDSEALLKLEDAWRRGRQFEKKNQTEEAVKTYQEALSWVASFKKMLPRLESWMNIQGDKSTQMQGDSANEWSKIYRLLSFETKEKWIKQLEQEKRQSRKIWIIWYLSLESMIDYDELSPCLNGVVIEKNDDDAYTIFGKVFSSTKDKYTLWEDEFHEYVKEYKELLASHCLDKDMEQLVKAQLQKQMHFFGQISISSMKFPDQEWIDGIINDPPFGKTETE